MAARIVSSDPCSPPSVQASMEGNGPVGSTTWTPDLITVAPITRQWSGCCLTTTMETRTGAGGSCVLVSTVSASAEVAGLAGKQTGTPTSQSAWPQPSRWFLLLPRQPQGRQALEAAVWPPLCPYVMS